MGISPYYWRISAIGNSIVDIAVYIAYNCRRMRKTERLLYILSLLRSHRRLRASDLAKKCGVTERTIYRDIISISAANIPIYFDGGYKLLHDGFLPPSNLSPHETGFILSLLKSPMFGKGKPFNETASRIADKIEVAGEEGPERSSIAIGVVSTEKAENHRHTRMIEKAVREKKNMVVSYESLKGEKTQRKISPYAMAFRKHAWYLVGYCHLRRDIRTFRVGRILSVRLSREKFEIPETFSVEKYFSTSWGVYRGKLTRFKVRFKGEAAIIVKTSQHQPYEAIEELDSGDIIYEAIVSGKVEFIRWVLGFGGDAEILDPASARMEISKMLETALSNYNRPQAGI